MTYIYNIEKIKKGDETEFHLFFNHFYPKLISIACRFVDEEEAKDLVQDIFIAFWEQKASLKADNLESFLHRWLQNRCINHLKHQEVVSAYEAKIRIAEARAKYMQENSDKNTTLLHLQHQELRLQIEEAINKLPPKCAKAFRLFYFHEISQKEIAEIMGISVRTVEGHIHQALKQLRRELKSLLPLVLWLLITH